MRVILLVICLTLLHSAVAQGDFQEEDDVRISEIQVRLFYRRNSSFDAPEGIRRPCQRANGWMSQTMHANRSRYAAYKFMDCRILFHCRIMVYMHDPIVKEADI
jgi:hypothetical protein